MNLRDQLNIILKNKELVFLLSCLVFLLIIVAIILFTLTRSSKNAIISSSPTPTPTPVQSTSTSLENNQSGVSIYEPLAITFSPALSEKEKLEVQIIGNPPLLLDRTWDTTNTKLALIPLTALKPNQKYTLNISTPRGKIVRTFTTTSNEAESSITESGLTKEEVGRLYPWYNKLPLFTGKYHVSFNLKTKEFSAIIYLSNPAQETQIKEITLSELKKIGVNTNDFKINWRIN